MLNQKRVKDLSVKEDPRENAKRHWNRGLVGATLNNNSWAAVAIVSLSIALMALFFSFSHMSEQKLIPYVVVVDKESGQVSFKGVADRSVVTVTDAMYRSYLQRFITDFRSISSDLVVLKTNLSDAWYLLSNPSVQGKFLSEIRAHDRFKESTDGERVDIAFRSFSRQAENTFIVQWEEQTRDKGILTNVVEKIGVFSFVRGDPKTVEDATRNPLGLYISDYDISDVKPGVGSK